jgi:uncharacterized protein YjlB
VEYIKRSRNTEADESAKVVTHNKQLPIDVFFHVIKDALVKMVEPEPRLINIIEREHWREPIMAYLHHYFEPNSTTEHIRMQQRAKAYKIIDNDMYKTSISGTLL